VGVGLAAFLVVLIISLTGPAHSTAPGCVDVPILGATGAAAIHQCGSDARSLCHAAGAANGYQGQTRRQIQAACRQDGFTVG
jgi:hypothetical protein